MRSPLAEQPRDWPKRRLMPATIVGRDPGESLGAGGFRRPYGLPNQDFIISPILSICAVAFKIGTVIVFVTARLNAPFLSNIVAIAVVLGFLAVMVHLR